MNVRSTLSIILSVAALSLAPAQRAAYDPLHQLGPAPVRWDLVIRDAARVRDVPILVYLPTGTETLPVVLFSHGLGGSREMGAFLGDHWARRGYVAVFVQHPGSDVDVWQGKGLTALVSAANAQNLLLRVQDISAVLDQIDRWHQSQGHALRGRVDMGRVGMSGHSFGAITTQAVSGQRFPADSITPDARIKAAVAMSPSPPQRGSAAVAFAAVRIPWLVMTGTRDTSPIGNITAASRLDVFPALPPTSKYELVLDGAEHSAFTDRALPGDRGPRNPNHHRAILAISTAFWDAYLRGDSAARAWIDGSGPRTVLEPRDSWKTK